MSKAAKIWVLIGVVILIVLTTIVYQLYKHNIALPEETYTKMPSPAYTTKADLEAKADTQQTENAGDAVAN